MDKVVVASYVGTPVCSSVSHGASKLVVDGNVINLVFKLAVWWRPSIFEYIFDRKLVGVIKRSFMAQKLTDRSLLSFLTPPLIEYLLMHGCLLSFFYLTNFGIPVAHHDQQVVFWDSF